VKRGGVPGIGFQRLAVQVFGPRHLTCALRGHALFKQLLRVHQARLTRLLARLNRWPPWSGHGGKSGIGSLHNIMRVGRFAVTSH
jgi:hypothetical protein